MSIITTSRLCYTYSDGAQFSHFAIRGIDFSIERGEIVGIIGHTGSGKSTFIQMLNGLLKPNSGEVFFEEKNIWAEPKKIRNIRFGVGLVFQYPEYQLFEETVYKDIAFGPSNMGLSKIEIDRRVRNTAALMCIDDEMLEKSPFDLSGGEKRRVAIAGILAMEPQVLILDEPTAGLDPKGRRQIADIILNYRDRHNAAVIVVSHNMDDLAQIADRLIVINNGSVMLEGSVKDVFSQNELLLKNGLDVPHATSVFIKLKELGVDLGTDVFTVSEAADRIAAALNGGERRA